MRLLILIICFSIAGLVLWQKTSNGPTTAVTKIRTLTSRSNLDQQHRRPAAENAAFNSKAAAVRSSIDHYLQRTGFSGAAVIVSHGHVVLSKGYGFRNISLGLRNNSSTQYYIASLSKSITATAFMQMREQGLIGFNTTVSQFYPAFPHGRSITMLDLLCHVSGLKGIPETARLVSRDEQIQRIADANLKLASRPGTRWSYQDDNYTVIAAILDKISLKSYRETFHQYVQKNIFDKAKMTQAGFGGKMLLSPDRSIGYTAIAGPGVSFSQLLGCGDVYTSAWDLYLFDHALTNGTLLSHSSYQNVFKKHFAITDYGLGWYYNRANWGRNTYSSHGVYKGWHSSNAFTADRQNFAVLLSNSSRTSNIFGAANKMIFEKLSKL